MTGTKHIYLSPHLDDAVLSCGGAIHRQVAAGDQVLVITFFAGEANPVRTPAGLSTFALLQHSYWGSVARPMALRRLEDAAALTVLEAHWYHLGYLDAVYRTAPDGGWLYTDLETLFGEVHREDPMAPGKTHLTGQMAAFALREGRTAFYAPLAVGGHVDHQIIRATALELRRRGHRVALYEDYPYAARPEAVESAVATAGGEKLLLEQVYLEPADVAARVAAIGYYRSQMGILFRGVEAMATQVWAFAASRSPEGGLAERIWWLHG